MPYSPLGRGFLTGTLDADTTFGADDARTAVPRFSAEARRANRALVELLETIATRVGATPAPIALAWLLAQRPWIVPIPGTTKIDRLRQNVAAADVDLGESDLAEIERALATIDVVGTRDPEHLRWLDASDTASHE